MPKREMASQPISGWYVEFQLAVLRALPRDISQEVADQWRLNGEYLAATIRDTLMPQAMNREQDDNPPAERLFDAVGIVTVPATQEPLVARDYFVGEIKFEISYLGEDFQEWFLGKIEPPFLGSVLRFGQLRKPSEYKTKTPMIITALGGESSAETSLTEAASLMAVQANGEPGALLTNGHGNLFYIRDRSDILDAVIVRWEDFGWSLEAYPVESSLFWNDNCLIFSRHV